MRLVNLKNVMAGMTLAKGIYSCEGKVLLAEGVTLTGSYIDRLKEMSIHEVYIEDAISKDIQIRDIINDQTRIAAKTTIYQVVRDLKLKKSFDMYLVNETINRIVDDLLSNKNIIINLTDLRSADEYTFSHSVNVAVISIVIGKTLGYNQLKLRDLGIGALLHDIGKTEIPLSILNKPGKLESDEIEIMRKHTVYGYEILKQYPNISILSRGISLMHHERIDGTGYPYGKKGDEIHEFAKIVAIADTYDAMTSNRIYKKKVAPEKAIEYLISTGNYNYDYNIVKLFLNHVTIYPVGTIVRLNTKQKGIVMDNNQYSPTRPIVRILKDQNIDDNCEFEEIDLQKNLTVFIEETCDE
ncbi:HD-GYP domain-containing protein [Geosporobacter ferrireducens]|uniref:Uncharacterized protein n=1 Tax=Geosporobacter ferrireducens TaxID=1424294 RepID=A0A1D8GCG2_9FIRM|nr:HD-GYP domain-containing protein [Geosporobacter ferrireducens]AOT68597.1 hypothetical protein Gferi_02685 [Geosporobacter ferrireducens]MTI54066.1 HD-GYP domain-containing protein [Geosporobacter ferrireducens]